MPSIEETCILSAGNTTTQDFLARDMEELVSEIKENLRLSGFKSRHSNRTSRPSPYQIPSRSWGDASCEWCIKSPRTCSIHSCFSKKNTKSNPSDDPYEMLQDLLRDGSLIKEAVRRLQKGLSPKQRYLYESDEEASRSPMRPCVQ